MHRTVFVAGSRPWLPATCLACACVAGAIACRRWFLADLGTALPFITFYPAVAFAVITTGFAGGLLTLGLSVASVLFADSLVFGAAADVDWWHLGTFLLVGSTFALLSGCKQHVSRELRDLNRQLAEARDRAEATTRTKSAFIADLSHELRSPLSAILGFAELLRERRDLAPDTAEGLRLIHSSGRQMQRLISDALDMERIEAGRIEVLAAPTDLDAVLDNVLAPLRRRAVAKGLALSVERDSAVPAWVHLDAGRLSQVLANLVENALRHTTTGGIRIRLVCEDGSQGGRLAISVIDTGRGIAETDQQRIFEPFTRLPAGSSSPGAGLGLSIANRLALAMGGSISLSSRLGEGSAFTLHLPLRQAQAPPAPAAQALAGGRLPRLAPGHPGFRILTVDDDPINRELIATHLARIGLASRPAACGEEAVETVRTWPPDLIWMDLRLPGIDGLETSRRIRTLLDRRTRIVAVTASASPDKLGELRHAGIDDILVKPYRPEELYACLLKHLPDGFASGDATPPEDDGLAPATLGGLPRELREELRRALVGLDPTALAACTARVSAHDPELGRVVAGHVQRLELTRLLRALDGMGASQEEGR